MGNLEKNLAILQEACASPKARLEHYLAEGKKVIGCFPPYCPEELVHAAGMVPFGLWGGRVELKLAKSYLPAFACPIMQADMELALQGSYEGLSAIIVPAFCDTLRCMTQNFRFGVKSIPMIPIVYPQNRTNPASVDYLISEFESVLVALNMVTGQMVSEASLKETLAVYNAHNAAMREFSKVAGKHPDVITPKVRHAVMKSAWFYEKSEHTAIVREIIEELNARPEPAVKGKKIVLSGIMCEPDEVLDILEENGVTVVADDLAQESRQFRTDYPEKGGGGLKRIALQWQARYGCSLIHELGKPRGHLLGNLARENGADGVINCLMKFCDPEEYDQPYLEKDLAAEGIPVITVEIDTLSASYEQFRTRVQTFCDML